MNPTTANMTTVISTDTNRNPNPPLSVDYPSEQINMEKEEQQKTTLTTTTMMMNTTASNLYTISDTPVVVVSDDDEDTDTDTDTDNDNDDNTMKATTLLLSSTHLSSIVSSQKRRNDKHRREVTVRFKKEDSKYKLVKKATNWKGKKMISGSRHTKTPTGYWYTQQEMKDNYKSLSRSSIMMVGTDDGITQQQQCTSLSWFSYEKRLQRRIMRKQMYKIMKAIQDYELATQTKVPELLSQLLDRHSKPMVEEGIRIAEVASTSIDDTVVC